MKVFATNSGRRIAEATRRSEQTPRFRVQRGQIPPLPPGCVYMEVTEQVGLKVGSKLGKGRAKLKILTYDASDDATLADHPDPTGYRLYSGASAAGATISVGRLVIAAPMYGRFHAIVDFC